MNSEELLNKFRIDQILFRDEGVPLVCFSVVGRSIDEALTGSIGLVAPHLEAGMHLEVIRTGVWCTSCHCYHEITSAEHEDLDECCVDSSSDLRPN